MTTVLPELERKLEVVVATRKLPRPAQDARPRIDFDLSHQGHTLSILPVLVYGDPPVARVDGDTVTPLGNRVPTRRRDEEREALRRLRDELNLVPGRRVDLNGTEAIRFAAKLREWQKRAGDGAHAKAFTERPLHPKLVQTGGGVFDVVFECEGGRSGHKDGVTARREARGRGGRRPRLARRARPRPARRGRVGPAAGGLARPARATSSPTCSRPGTTRRRSASPRSRASARSATRSRPLARPSSRASRRSSASSPGSRAPRSPPA